ncbi:MAG: hypothetical protein AB1384_07085 [Actinomycetota bacterium]
MDMITCGGCGRKIETTGMDYGIKVLCENCYHLQVTGPQPEHSLSSTALKLVFSLGLAALALACAALCVLYLSGTGDLPWFILLSVLALAVVVCPVIVLSRKRNLSLLMASLYLPLGLWAFVWQLAPGVGWEYGRMTAYGGLLFLALGLVAAYTYVRDLRALPRR